MPQLLIELFSEEIPARMQGNAARDLERLFTDRLKDAGLAYESARSFAGPRRLALVVEGLPAAQEDRTEERKGPRANAPDQAIEGFLRSTGLSREQLVERDGVYFANLSRKGRPTPEIVAEALDGVIRDFPWPKSMTWGEGSLRWVRPLKRIVCLFGGEVVPFEIEGVRSGDLTEGHRFMGSGQPIQVRDFDSYRLALADNRVVLDAADRKRTIVDRARKLCEDKGLQLVEDEGLLDEVAGLAEWPTPVLGDMDPTFLDLPGEVIRTSMRTHQKYFAVRDPKTEKLAAHFVTVANIEATDGGAAIAKGNARVLSARLNDARFFWDEDRKPGKFAAWAEKLQGVTFHAKLGTMSERVARIAELARVIADRTGANSLDAVTAVGFAKGDLASGMVGEFPELQGLMGYYYALNQGVAPALAEAIRDHYKPQGPNDDVPPRGLPSVVALADKLDTLVGFFSIGEKPTGSRDPQGLRRASLGIIRILLTHGIRLSIGEIALGPYQQLAEQLSRARLDEAAWKVFEAQKEILAPASGSVGPVSISVMPGEAIWDRWLIVRRELLDFFADRLKVALRDQGRPHDLVDAVFALGDDDLVRVVARVEALAPFLKTDDGANLLAGYRRAVNILKAEAKKNPSERYDGAVDPARFSTPEETALHAALTKSLAAMEAQLEAEDFTSAMTSLAALRAPVDAFFDKVLVNDPDPDVRLNRLRLLSQIRDAANRVADFSLISG